MKKVLVSLTALIALNAFASGANLKKNQQCAQAIQDFLGTPINQNYVNFTGIGSPMDPGPGESKCEVAIRHSYHPELVVDTFDILLNTEIDLGGEASMAKNTWLGLDASKDTRQSISECTATATDLVVKASIAKDHPGFGNESESSLHVTKDAAGNLASADFYEILYGGDWWGPSSDVISSGYCKDLKK